MYKINDCEFKISVKLSTFLVGHPCCWALYIMFDFHSFAFVCVRTYVMCPESENSTAFSLQLSECAKNQLPSHDSLSLFFGYCFIYLYLALGHVHVEQRKKTQHMNVNRSVQDSKQTCTQILLAYAIGTVPNFKFSLFLAPLCELLWCVTWTSVCFMPWLLFILQSSFRSCGELCQW